MSFSSFGSFLVATLLAVGFLGSSGPCAAAVSSLRDDSKETAALEGQAKLLVATERYHEFESLAGLVRAERRRSSAGRWLLPYLYRGACAGLEEGVAGGSPDPEARARRWEAS